MKKKLVFLILSVLATNAFATTTETNLKVLRVGSWAQGNATFYIKVDRVVGPTSCRSNLIKVDLGTSSDSQAELMSMNMVRSMALTAFASESNVELVISDSCLYNNPTIDLIWLHK